LKTPRRLVALSFIIIVVSAVVVVYLTRTSVPPSIALAPSTFVAVQGTQIAFSVFGLESNAVATVYFGDGHEANTTSTVTYTYPNPGRYLIAAQEYINSRPVSSTFNALQTIQVTSQVTATSAPLISVPAVSFDISRNPSAPVVHVGDDVALLAGYLQPPSGTNITISQYVWDFGNGANKMIVSNSTSFNPIENPVSTTFGQPGLYAVTLTLVTENSTSMTTYRNSVEQSLAVASNTQPYALFLYAGSVPNPSVINVAENAAGARTLSTRTSPMMITALKLFSTSSVNW
jgi:PKD repeat protein